MPRDEDAARLQTGLRALDLWPGEEAARAALLAEVFAYLDLLQRWNRRHNLTAVRDPAQMLVHHVLDCAAVVPVLRAWVGSRAVEVTNPVVFDVGSGAGLPGIVLAWFWPQARVVLIEPAAKRAAFLQLACARPALANVRVVRSRIEDVPIGQRPPDAIICRAFSSLSDYAQAIAHLVGLDTVVAAMKARLDQSEKCALASLVDAPATPKSVASRRFHPGGDSPLIGWRVIDEQELQVPGLAARRCLVRLEPMTGNPSGTGAVKSADLLRPAGHPVSPGINLGSPDGQ